MFLFLFLFLSVPDQQRSFSPDDLFSLIGIQVILSTMLSPTPMPDRDTRAHSSKSSTVSSDQLPPTPCVLRQSDILNTLNIVHVQLETAEHVKLVAVT